MLRFLSQQTCVDKIVCIETNEEENKDDTACQPRYTFKRRERELSFRLLYFVVSFTLHLNFN